MISIEVQAMATLTTTEGNQLTTVKGFRIIRCEDCNGYFFLPINKKTKVQDIAPGHVWKRGSTNMLRHSTEEDRKRQLDRLQPYLSTIQKIVDVLNKKANLNFSEIRLKTGMSSRTVDKALKKLEANNVVTFCWYGKNKRFTLNIEEAKNFIEMQEQIQFSGLRSTQAKLKKY